ncbi:MAG: PLDc N-terminal domain-containing protein [Actinomycetaceae bacterium]|nr:PLDc N-terminal domain-containing protein [Actinomycetaceae bacterium]
MARVLMVLLVIALTVYAIADCARTPSDEMPARIPKALWILLILILTPFGAIGWIIISRVQRAETRGGKVDPALWSSSGPASIKFPRGRRRQGPLAPDDDPAYLRKIEQEMRRMKREEMEAERRQAEEQARNPEEQEGPQEHEGPGGDQEPEKPEDPPGPKIL